MNGSRTIPAVGVGHAPFRTRRLAHEDLVWAPGHFLTIAIAVGATCIPIVLHLTGQAMGIAACAGIAVLLGLFAAPALPICLIFAYLSQNFVVALVSPAIDSIEQFNAIRAYNFVFTVVAWAAVTGPYWLTRASYDRRFRRIIDLTTAGLVVVGAYFVIGLAANPSGAIVYMRNIATPILLFQVFAFVAYRHRLSMTIPLLVLALFALGYGYLELLAHDALFRSINGDVYLNWRIKQDYEAGVWVKELHETGRVMRSYLDTLLVDFLNTPLLQHLELRFYRLLGPNFHFISYAYALAVFCVILCATGRWWYGALALPLLLIVGSKGALVFAVLVMLALITLLRLRGFAPLLVMTAVLLTYVAVGILAGIQTQDYHVMGFFGGLRGFMSNPIGRGIGGRRQSVDGNEHDRLEQITASGAHGCRSRELGRSAALPNGDFCSGRLRRAGVDCGAVVAGLSRQRRAALCGGLVLRPDCAGKRRLPGGGDLRAPGARHCSCFRRAAAGSRLPDRRIPQLDLPLSKRRNLY